MRPAVILLALLVVMAPLALSGPPRPTAPPRVVIEGIEPTPTPTPIDVPPVAATDLEPLPLPVADSSLALEGTPVPVAQTDEAESSVAVTPVEPLQPRVRVRVPRVADEPAVVALAVDMEDVLHVESIDVITTTLGQIDATVTAVEPETFRVFTPGETANHAPLWQRLAAGDVAVSHAFGSSHSVELGSTLGLGPGELPFRVGAYASNGTPPVGDAIISRDRARTLDLIGQRTILLAVAREGSPTAIAEELVDAGFDAEEIADPRAPRDDIIIPQGGLTQENVWDHLALCESSGNWQINTGNGYYGGIQFLPESWAAVGGTGLPHEHTREEQIYRGTLLWQIQGWNAWPQCARRLGLIVD